MAAWHPGALVSRQGAPTAEEAAAGDAMESVWCSAAARREQRMWAEQSEQALLEDAAFKKHQAHVERALARFESVSEWADFISFLARLLKTLQSAPQFPVVPLKLIVAKRLSQCLNPALPSGVHTRALDVYRHIFTVIGVEGLRRDVAVWTPGLLPFFQHAATSVRPALLDLFERFYVPLSVDLRPLTRALLLSLLPGLEEEGSEFFDRVIALLDSIAASAGVPFFVQNVWTVLMWTPGVRLSALHFLARRMPSLAAPDAPWMGLDPPRMVCAFVAALGDESLLVRRHALDFLVAHVALSARVFCELPPPAQCALVDAALAAVLRRDISLNRRLYAWLLGPADADDTQQAYFTQHALPVVSAALLERMRSARDDASPAATARPYKIFVALMDRVSIGQPLVRAIVLDVLQTLVAHDLHVDADLWPTAQMLFDAVDSYVLYQHLFCAIRADVEAGTGAEVRGVQEEDGGEANGAEGEGGTEGKSVAGDTAEGRAVGGTADGGADEGTADGGADGGTAEEDVDWGTGQWERGAALAFTRRLFLLFTHLDEDARVVYLPAILLYLVGMEAREQGDAAGGEESVAGKEGNAAGNVAEAARAAEMAGATRFLSALLDLALRHIRPAQTLLAAALTALGDARSGTYAAPHTGADIDLDRWGTSAFACVADASSFDESARVLQLLLDLSRSDAVPGTFDWNSARHIRIVLGKLIPALQPDNGTHHAVAARLFFAAQQLSPADALVAALCARVAGNDVCAATAFGTLWRFAGTSNGRDELTPDADGHASTSLRLPMLVVLDDLRASDALARTRSVQWLRTYVASFDTLLRVCMDGVAAVSAETRAAHARVGAHDIAVWSYTRPFDQDTLNYYLATLGALVDVGGAAVLSAARAMHARIHGADGALLDTLTACLLRLLRTLPSAAYRDVMPANVATHVHAISVLSALLAAAPPTLSWCRDVERALGDVLLLGLRHAAADEVPILALGALQAVIHARALSAVDVDEPRRVRLSASTGPDDARVRLADLIREGLTAAPTSAQFLAWLQFVQGIVRVVDAPEFLVRRELVNLIAVLEQVLLLLLPHADADKDAEGEQTTPARVVGSLSSMSARDAPQLDAEADTASPATRGTRALLDTCAGSAQIVVAFLCDSLQTRTAGAERSALRMRARVGELILFRFLEAYVSALDAVVDSWPVLFLLAKHATTQQAGSKVYVYHTLRIVQRAGDRMAHTHALDDRRLRREVQEQFVRLSELLISLYTRALDLSLRRSDRDSDAASLAEDAESADGAPPPPAVVAYLATGVVPGIAAFAVEQDKAVALCTSIVYYVLAPGLRARSRTDVDPLVLDVLQAMSALSHTVKTWRSIALDVFFDARFFATPPAAARVWCTILGALFVADRDRLVDVIARVSSAPTTNLFTSRESDLAARMLSIRRLAFAVYTGGTDTFLAQLPAIQEKVVDTLRAQAPDLVQAEIYMCMRVLLCRFSSQHLSGFWPIILTELLRIFGAAKTHPPAPGSDALQLLFSVAKLADFLVTLQTDDFQIHQWLLVTDTPDAVVHAPDYAPDALLDSIALSPPAAPARPRARVRRPLLQASRVDSVDELLPFLARVSRTFFLAQDMCSAVDWDNINACLLRDLLETGGPGRGGLYA
ncbi:hypothetical protein MSPP1_000689 [Malassezia sp. CBS 17886]|nr:hypothetical protein MSPP1_000689 [Malassezia sp. CBS 17886]